MAQKRILWVENEIGHIKEKVDALEDEGFVVRVEPTPRGALDQLESSSWNVVVVDNLLPHGPELSETSTDQGTRTGLALGRLIRRRHPDIPLVCCSTVKDPKAEHWFGKYGDGFWPKTVQPDTAVRYVRKLLGDPAYRPKMFLVHGHDNEAVLELSQLLQNSLGLGEPTILRDQPQAGRTIIEKFEEYALDSDLVFVLLTPDDSVESLNVDVRRSRQNVIFELGFFYGLLGRRSGRVILLHKGAIELPTDISGIVYIPIDNGVKAASEDLRTELQGLGFID